METVAEVEVVATLAEARRRLADAHYQLVILDLTLPDGSGEELLPLLQPDDIIWVHDYHLIPLAAELRKRGQQQKIGDQRQAVTRDEFLDGSLLVLRKGQKHYHLVSLRRES